MTIQPAMNTVKKVKKPTTDQSMLWGSPVEFWDLWGLRLMVAGAGFGALALAISLASSFILLKTSGVTQSLADRRIEDAAATASQAAVDVAKANEAAAKANERAATLEKEAQELRLDAARMREHVAWRRITKSQHDSIVAVLAGHKFSVWTSFVGRDPEATAFRNDIDQTLKNAGIETKFFSGWDVSVGLAISEEPAGAERDAVVAAFAAAGLPLRISPLKPMGDNSPQIIVGTKPPPF